MINRTNKIFLVTGGGVLLICLAVFGLSAYYLFTSSQIDRFYFKHFVIPSWTGDEIPKANIEVSPLLTEEYIIQKGDTLWNLSKKFNTSIDTIVSYNNPKKVHVITVNSKIQVPFIDGIMIEGSNLLVSNLSDRYRIASKNIYFFNPELKVSFDNRLTNQKIFLPGAYFNLSERMGKLGAEFLKPLKDIHITSLFGLRVHPVTKKRSFHKGIDLRGRSGDRVYSAKGGRVVFAGFNNNSGNLVIIKHNKGLQSYYAHLSKILVRTGQQISVQALIGMVGQSGRVTGPHLHFEVRKNGRAIDPRAVTELH